MSLPRYAARGPVRSGDSVMTTDAKVTSELGR